MGTSERHHPLADTQELVAMWNETKEQHFVQQLAQLLPSLIGAGKLDKNQTEDVSRHLIRAFQVAASPAGGVHAAMDYLRNTVGPDSS